MNDIQGGAMKAFSVRFFVAGLIVTLVVLWYLNSTLPGARQVRAFVGVPGGSTG